MNSLTQRGAAAVEFALILPLLLLLIFGIIEFGVLIYDKAMLTNASREAARAGVVFGLSEEQRGTAISSALSRYLGDSLITFGAGSNYSSSPVIDDDHLIVTVSYQYDFLLLPAFVTDLTGGINLQARTRMRLE